MSGLTTKAALDAIGIKKNFPNAGALLSKLTTNITTTWTTGSPYTQTDSTGVVELTISVSGVAALTGLQAGVLVAFGAPNDTVAATWFADTTKDSNVLQYVYVPEGTTRTFHFSPALTRWDYQAVVNTVTIYQEIAR